MSPREKRGASGREQKHKPNRPTTEKGTRSPPVRVELPETERSIMDTECKTLWMGDIQMHWDEAFIASLFASAGTNTKPQSQSLT